MVKIALIDDEIALEMLNSPEKIDCFYKKTREREKSEVHVTHGTLCAGIIEEYAVDYHLFAFGLYFKNGQSSIIDFITALDMCLKMEVDIISLSVGTVKLSDSIILQPIISKVLEKNIIIVASNSNGCWRTLPAYFNGVVSVITDPINIIGQDMIRLVERNEYNIDVISKPLSLPCMGFIKEMSENSIGTPLVTSLISNELSVIKGRNISEVMDRLRSHYKIINTAELKNILDIKKKRSTCRNIDDIPHIQLHFERGQDCQKYCTLLLANVSYEIAIVTNLEINDPRIVRCGRLDIITGSEDLDMQVDIIFYYFKNSNKEINSDIDFVINDLNNSYYHKGNEIGSDRVYDMIDSIRKGITFLEKYFEGGNPNGEITYGI
jgi:hypothetical protein